MDSKQANKQTTTESSEPPRTRFQVCPLGLHLQTLTQLGTLSDATKTALPTAGGGGAMVPPTPSSEVALGHAGGSAFSTRHSCTLLLGRAPPYVAANAPSP